MNHPSNEQSPYPDTPEKRVCMDCGDILVWLDLGGTPGYYWKKSSYCPGDPLAMSHRRLTPLSHIYKEVDEIERLWRQL